MREPMLILHFIGLAMGLGSGLSFLFLGAAAGKMEPAKRREFMANVFPVSGHGANTACCCWCSPAVTS
ncbi:MAG: hypothetical protein IPO17_18315 [Flavobacteriales bacterium]|nr:hypothetical protein [Flavobacteriales bacterium]